jgi:hypothetical protein
MTNLSDLVHLAHAEAPQRRPAALRELDRRRNDDVSVALLWNAETNRVFVSVAEERTGVSFKFEVAGADAADAFHHPYVYAGHDYQMTRLPMERRSGAGGRG